MCWLPWGFPGRAESTGCAAGQRGDMGCLEPHRASAGVEGKGRLWWPQSSGTGGAHSMSGAQIPAPGTAGLWNTWRLSERARVDAERTTALPQGNACVQCRY